MPIQHTHGSLLGGVPLHIHGLVQAGFGSQPAHGSASSQRHGFSTGTHAPPSHVSHGGQPPTQVPAPLQLVQGGQDTTHSVPLHVSHAFASQSEIQVPAPSQLKHGMSTHLSTHLSFIHSSHARSLQESRGFPFKHV
jgi:hypothetical protein